MIIKRLTQPSIVKNEKEFNYSISSLNDEDVRKLLSIEYVGGGVFGIESYYSHKYENTIFFCQPHFKVDWKKDERSIMFDNLNKENGEISFIQIFTEKSSMFPISMNNSESVWRAICSFCPQDMELMYQVLLVYRQDRWTERLEEQYETYLEGVEQPSNNGVLLRVQRGLSRKLDDFLQWDYKHLPIDELSEKLNENGFRYSIRLILKGGNKRKRQRLIEHIKYILNSFSYLNSWSVASPIMIDGLIDNIKFRKLDNIGKQQVLCVSELVPFLILEESVKADIIEEIEDITDNGKLVNPMELLPFGEGLKQVDGSSYVKRFKDSIANIKKFEGAKLTLIDVKTGATSVMMTFKIPNTIRLSDITKKNIIEDIQGLMGVHSLRITQGDGKSEINVFIPLEERQITILRDYIDTDEFREFIKSNHLPFMVGVDETGSPIFKCLNKARHLLIAGTTGSGKSAWINQLILTLLLSKSPNELVLYMIDVKRVEFPKYKNFPHVKEVITDAHKSIKLLESLIEEMERRYELFEKSGVNELELYNNKHKNKKLPYIVCVIDEYAELANKDKNVHKIIESIVALSRASGIHLIMATQDPRKEVIPPLIRSNLPSKIAFRCSNGHSYLTFLNTKPKVNLLGNGDGVMSFEGQIEEHIRFQGCLIIEDKKKLGLESRLINKVADSMNDYEVSSIDLPKPKEELTELDRLKSFIANTKETRVSSLRNMMKVNINRLNSLMVELADEGWLERPRSKQDGYKLVVDEEELKKWKSE